MERVDKREDKREEIYNHTMVSSSKGHSRTGERLMEMDA